MLINKEWIKLWNIHAMECHAGINIFKGEESRKFPMYWYGKIFNIYSQESAIE